MALVVDRALRVLFRRERPDKDTTKQLLLKVIKVLRAEVVEEGDN